ncbi:DUF6284 family protein [Micromonospora sp. NBC_01412]|uniref:DUF6284 family protein n=1 Tax=Micromonospora sp. NBC_01412 TaxID=2903590 RepID=UPI0032472A3C
MDTSVYWSKREPNRTDLAEIEREWPLIAAELDLVDAEITMIYAEDNGGPSPLDWRRLRRAESRVIRTAAEVAARRAGHVCHPYRLTEVRLASECRYGCKVMACQDCGAEQVTHHAAYGCPAGQSPRRAA